MANPYPIRIQGSDGIATLNGEATFTDPGNQPGGGGSQPGGLYKVDVLINEPAGPHADLAASFPIPAGSTVLDTWTYPLAGVWADAHAALSVGDTSAPNAYIDALWMVNLATVYDPASLSGANFGNLITFGNTFFNATPFVANVNALPGGGVLYPSDDEIVIAMAGIVTGGGGGQLLVRTWIVAPSTAIVAA